MPLDHVLNRKDQRKKLRLDPYFPVCLFGFFSPASHNRGSSCHQCCHCGRHRCLKERVEVAVLVSWGPEEAAGMALTNPPNSPHTASSLHSHLKGMSGVASVTAGIRESGLPVAHHCATAANATSQARTHNNNNKKGHKTPRTRLLPCVRQR